jgi:hypothetical protein
MTFLKIMLAAVAFLICLLFGAGGGCLIGLIEWRHGWEYGPSVGGIPVTLLTGLIGAAIGLVLGFLVAVQVYRALEHREN